LLTGQAGKDIENALCVVNVLLLNLLKLFKVKKSTWNVTKSVKIEFLALFLKLFACFLTNF
jgi:hypothetical protein